MCLSRRNFLKLAGSATLFAAMRGGTAVAQTGGAPKVLWVQLFGEGGWDQALLCDPKKGLRSWSDDNLVKTANGITWLETGVAADPVKDYFASYANNTLVINGIDTGTNNHDVGVRYSSSGSALEGFPIFAAQVAGVLGRDNVMPLIDVSGYDEAGGLIAPVRLDYIAVPRVAELQKINNPLYEYPWTAADNKYLPDTVHAAARSAHDARMARQLAAARLPGHKAGISALQRARNATTGLKNLELPAAADSPDENFKNLITMGVKSFKAGLATAVNVTTGALDAHGDDDPTHTEQIGRVLALADHAVKQANLADIPVVGVMSSDFGRTPDREGNGTGHWPISSMMILQNDKAKALHILPTGLIGGTTGEPRSNNSTTTALRGRKINMQTRAFSDTGAFLSPAHVFKALRRVAGIHDDALLRPFPIAVEGGELQLG